MTPWKSLFLNTAPQKLLSVSVWPLGNLSLKTQSLKNSSIKTWPPENLSFKTQPLKNSSQLKHDPSEISRLKHSPSKTPLLKHGPLKISLFWRQPQIVVVKFQFCKSSTCWNCVQGAEALEENYSDHLGKYLMAAHRVFLSVPILKIIKYQNIAKGTTDPRIEFILPK